MAARHLGQVTTVVATGQREKSRLQSVNSPMATACTSFPLRGLTVVT